MSLSWKSNISGTECRIFRGKVIVGLLKTSLWKDAGYGELNGYLLRFTTDGILKRVTKILDIDGQKELGQIRYNLWKGSAVISYENEQYEWKFESWTRRKWSVRHSEDVAEFSLTSFWKNEGVVEEESISGAVVLSALFANAYLRKISAAS
ncbi:hypothetical protein [Dyadobacter psychrophilus]|uniref:Uncharacterized protein n=1 Tax=Dyadobacter psychrophilus TaxID=651661 RepID=A0A1T5HFA7_9BACT|nr:hypothetical protein [Dyadobacter psychrophilus]SKC19324.1 hypothetical protein SAMN05660293_05453 [Dyadobacter psychrophilus]